MHKLAEAIPEASQAAEDPSRSELIAELQLTAGRSTNPPWPSASKAPICIHSMGGMLMEIAGGTARSRSELLIAGMELATAALSSLLPKLGTLLTDEYKLQKGVRGEIKFLQGEMESMQAALKKVSELPAHQIDDAIKIWVRDLKELSYDIEDSVDTFMVRVDASSVCAKTHSFRSFFDRAISLLTKAKMRRHIMTDMEEIKNRIHLVADRRARYKFENVIAQPDKTVVDSRLPALYEDVKNLIGIDSPAEKLTDLLMCGEGVQRQQLMVVSIAGVGGLGKTTLANLVFQRLREEFQCQAFVSVSLKPDLKKIFSSILRQVSRMESKYSNAEVWSHPELIDNIRQILENRRYIIVIDDVWDESAWTLIKCALVDNNLGSRVIVTTRNAGVAKFSCSPTDGAMFELPYLSGTDSKALFYKRILSDEEEIQSELKEISCKILKKCGGVPLAIITIASMLASRSSKTKYEWYHVYKSMGSGLEKEKALQDMREILSLSYADLPSYLKPCLLFVSIFPEDYTIPCDWLVDMWVAEGFVNEKKGKTLYEVGQSYLNELVNRNMLHPWYIDENGSVISCRVHDIILDLIISFSAQENFVTISEDLQLKHSLHRVRRLSLQRRELHAEEEQDSKKEELATEGTVDMSHVRSLIVFGHAPDSMLSLSRFSVLRTLSLDHFPSSRNNPPKILGSLHHLRYLMLGGLLETELLEPIGNLQLLKILNLRAASIKELPASIFQLTQLEQLLTRRMVKFPDGIGRLRSLQTLLWIDMSYAPPNILTELGNLTELRDLRIRGLNNDESYVQIFLQSLSNMHSIQTLDLKGDGNYYNNGLCSLDCRSDGWRVPAHLRSFDGHRLVFAPLPRWFSFLQELTYLSIRIRGLKQDDLQLLGALPVLRILKLRAHNDESTEEPWLISIDQPFRSLIEFNLIKTDDVGYYLTKE
ncbi:hypothetical protein U9M48_020110 [Paspalum notatum var. saurae]|uniref:Uncharacterized protein n=1 Tax=Paspalum notatum var. saurae TaxID=547442 RepID=A0AAQ3TE38_PASNO